MINRRLCILGGAMVWAMPVVAQTQRVSAPEADVAIRGYDTTAYFAQSAAVEGSAAYSVVWRGVNWQFATPKDARQFKANPDAYAPQFGGFCTRAMSFKKVVHGDPEVWRIFEGKLYLFAQPVGGSKFDQGQAEMIAKAQAYWDTLD